MQPDNVSNASAVRLRRRWGLAFFLSLIFGGTAAATVYLLFPPDYVAQSVIHIAATPPQVLAAGRGSEDFETYKKTQMFRATGRIVMTNALNEPVENEELKNQGYQTIADLPLLESRPFPENWLETKIEASGRNEEFFSIQMSHSEHPHQIAEIVNAITNVYLRDVANEDNHKKRSQIKLLGEALAGLEKKIQLSQNTIRQYSKSRGGPSSKLLTELDLAEQELIKQLRIERNQLRITIMKLEVLQSDELDADAVATLTEGIQPLLKSELGDKLALANKELSLEKRLDIMKRLLAKMDAHLAKQYLTPQDRNADDFALEELRADLKKFEDTSANIEQRTLQMQIELDAPDRIRLERRADVPRLRDVSGHYKKCTSAGVATAFLSFFAIALIAPRRRR